MALTIYKPGQGYWTRLLSGVGAGMVVVLGAHWLMTKLERLTGPYAGSIRIALAAAVVAGFGYLIFHLVAIKPATSDFLIATEGEMRKVNWPVRREVIGSTWVVICCVIFISTLLWITDIVFYSFFKWIGVVQGG